MTGRVEFSLDGRPLSAAAGRTVAAALLDAGIRSWRTTRAHGRPRGAFCGIGVCFDCLITVDGRPGVRACLLPVADGMELRSEGGGDD
ncbi:MAG: (2Fe-2S)-binding protein [Saccharothrix sp.]|nr:(2Fe-2S)-binding protein [Saccharothrix sp.]